MKHPVNSRSWPGLCVGVLIGILLSGAGFAFVRIGRGFATWGALQYDTDATVRGRIQAAGVVLPPEAYGLHYAAAGFVGSVWMKFTVPKEKIWTVVTASIGKSESDFLPKTPEHLLKEIYQNSDQTYDLGWWTPSAVTSPLSWSRTEGRFYEDWLIDMQGGTFYITRWDY
jgi:hypothetical protein